MESPSGANPKDQLIGFVTHTREDLKAVVSKIDFLTDDKRIQSLVRSAWDELEPRFQSMLIYTKEKVDSKYLEDRGLTGSQLELKMAVYARRRGEVRQKLEDTLSRAQRRRPWSRSPFRKVFRKLVDIIDSILRSLGIPGADAVGEFKDMLENVVED